MTQELDAIKKDAELLLQRTERLHANLGNGANANIRDIDVIRANLILASGSLQDAVRQLGIALKLAAITQAEAPQTQPEESSP